MLYMGSGNRHLVEVMLREIGHAPGPELEGAEDRESYALGAGFALGMITLGVGAALSLWYGHSPTSSSCSMAALTWGFQTCTSQTSSVCT